MAAVVRNRRQPWELTERDVTAAIARIGERDDDLARPPTEQDVRTAFHPAWSLLDVFGFTAEHGDWRHRAVSLTPAGESTVLAMLRATVAGPKSRPW